MANQNRYAQLISWVFHQHYEIGDTEVLWERHELIEAAQDLGVAVPKNLGDVIYYVRFGAPMPAEVAQEAPDGKEWVIRGRGQGKYAFRLVNRIRITPNPALAVIKLPDATPEIVSSAALGDEQALLALVRYNRLIDIFLGVAAYSLQNHLRTSVTGIGQVETDEVYVGVDSHGRQYVIPVQAKGHQDDIGITQTEQDIALCSEKWPHLVCRAVSVKFVSGKRLAIFELTVQNDEIRVLREAHYDLVPAHDISPDDLLQYEHTAAG
ncbi:endonuclease [Actinotignum sanguinis]|uniref:Endonuclease n=2 Tax=Actinomycetaceae TaxID=2049 RepID=A0ABZ0RBM0_9ACTO|nr:endonuclease [Actinotignum sanguinis]WPJ88400.1 endonuclease [Schaalia turicensis]MDE1553536.1 endonuclease [Actinotignum sanguinis]MDE1577685.1 endonuclease [Actinotignum sanguinis]MDE1641631.1 endonuclease [Actinotignum sanguinis]MDE1657005.1 endonuclease [Actinotignum sanguinis]